MHSSLNKARGSRWPSKLWLCASCVILLGCGSDASSELGDTSVPDSTADAKDQESSHLSEASGEESEPDTYADDSTVEGGMDAPPQSESGPSLGKDGDAAPDGVTTDGKTGLSDASTDGDGGPDDVTPDGDAGPNDASTDGDAGSGDASTDGDGADGESEVANTTEQLLVEYRGIMCDQCAQGNHCVDPGKRCDALSGEYGVAGPDTGESREQLCLDTLRCILNTMCYESVLEECITGQETVQECMMSGPVEGGSSCVAAEQAGLETTECGSELQMEYSATLGAGIANAIINCIDTSHCFSCY